ncbi:MAG TPA: HEAT repeat domain-containing protein [Gemmataceae bacterium]|nr:HEAT repeat domain-containing protein [Gemmataceae bacterium]
MRQFIDTFLEPALWFAASWSLRWAALLIVVALMLWIFRPRRAALRQSMLLAALAAGVLVPFAPRWGGGWQRTHQLAKPSISPAQSVTPSFPSSAWERTSGSSASRPTLEPAAKQSFATGHSQAELGNESEPPSEPLGRRRLIALSLVSGWSCAVLCLLIRRLCGWFILWRLRRESVAATGATSDLFAACRAEMHLRGRVRLAAHPRVRSPVLFGFLRTMILVPPDWAQRAIEAQRAGLLHELAHVRRLDHLLAPLLEIVRIAFFFHPLVRWLLRRLEYERELLCDEMVVRQGVDPRDYARLLLELARSSGRLAWPAVSLPMARRRTVKGRIHHLLEEDMERWIRPLPMRWTVVLGSGLLALMLGLASYRLLAVENEPSSKPAEKEKPVSPKDKKRAAPEKTAVPRLKREELRYGGKDFNEWRHDLLTELKGSIRVDGMKAFAAFGANGYGPEATQAILDIMRGYDTTYENPKDDDGAVVSAGYLAILKIGADAVPILTEAVKSANRNVRRFAIQALGSLGKDARSAIPAILQAMKDGDADTQLRVIYAVRRIDKHAKGVVAAHMTVLKGKYERNRLQAMFSLQQIGEEARPAIPALIAVLNDKSGEVRVTAINTLQIIGAGKEAVGPVSRLLRDKDFRFNVQLQAYRFLQGLGADAKEAVPALIAIVKEPKGANREAAIETLGIIGPGAKEALPILNELLRDKNGLRRDEIVEALKRIDPKGDR